MPAFTPDQWLILGLVFLLGLAIGMMLMAGGKWKRRYREEVALREDLQKENAQLRKDAAEMESLRSAAARDEVRKRTDTPGPL
jgi:uncharacterized membrane-anchored protein YhcB (DUF1043 family)